MAIKFTFTTTSGKAVTITAASRPAAAAAARRAGYIPVRCKAATPAGIKAA